MPGSIPNTPWLSLHAINHPFPAENISISYHNANQCFSQQGPAGNSKGGKLKKLAMAGKQTSFHSDSSVNGHSVGSNGVLGPSIFPRSASEAALDNSPKFRQLPCRTFVSVGTCPYRERCVYLHDPRCICRDAKTKTRKKNKEDTVNDSMFWPIMPISAISTKLDSSSQPHVIQPYHVPQPKEDQFYLHDRSVYSMWMHFLDFCMANSEIKVVNGKQILGSFCAPDHVNNVYTKGRRLDIFIYLSRINSQDWSGEEKGSTEYATWDLTMKKSNDEFKNLAKWKNTIKTEQDKKFSTSTDLRIEEPIIYSNHGLSPRLDSSESSFTPCRDLHGYSSYQSCLGSSPNSVEAVERWSTADSMSIPFPFVAQESIKSQSLSKTNSPQTVKTAAISPLLKNTGFVSLSEHSGIRSSLDEINEVDMDFMDKSQNKINYSSYDGYSNFEPCWLPLDGHSSISNSSGASGIASPRTSPETVSSSRSDNSLSADRIYGLHKGKKVITENKNGFHEYYDENGTVLPPNRSFY